MTSCTKERFLRDVRNHKLTILRDDGLYRHVRMKAPGTSCMHFDLITWPGYLCYTGDMGTYVFTRLADMFSFFRANERNWLRPLDSIDHRYWAEKIEGADKCDGITEFDPDEFILEVKRRRFELLRERGRELEKEQRRELWDDISIDVLDPVSIHSSEEMAYRLVNEFQFIKPYTGYRPSPGDYFCLNTEDWPSCKSYALRFTWCCFALRWAIASYDIHKAFQKAAA